MRAIMNRFWKNYSLSIVLFLLFLFSWLGQFVSQWQEFVENSWTHNQTPEFSQFLPEFWSATFENWQSEFLQLLTFVTLTSFLIHKGSPESKDTDERTQQSLDRIEKKLATK